MSNELVGIYCYMDKETGEIVYVGKDSYIANHKRHKQHLQLSNYNRQPFNRILQNNPNRYEYRVLRTGEFNNNWLSALEILYIRRYNPKFNYTIGGDGINKGKKLSDEHKKKIGEANKGKTSWIKGKYHSVESKKKMSDAKRGKTHTEETKRKMSLSHKGKKLSDETKRKMSESQKGHEVSEETKLKISMAHRGKSKPWLKGKKKKYARIIKGGFIYGKQNYCIMKEGKEIKKSIYPFKLLDWFINEYPKEILQIKINMEE